MDSKIYRNPLCLYAFISIPLAHLLVSGSLFYLVMSYRFRPSDLIVVVVLLALLFIPAVLLYSTVLTAKEIEVGNEEIRTIHPSRRGSFSRTFPNKDFKEIKTFWIFAYASGEKTYSCQDTSLGESIKQK